MSNQRNFLNGAFIKKTYEKNDSLLLSMWLPDLDKFINELRRLPLKQFKDTKGVSLTIGTQKNDKNKFSIWLDDYEKTASAQPGYQPAPKTSSAYGDVQQGPPQLDSSDLPF